MGMTNRPVQFVCGVLLLSLAAMDQWLATARCVGCISSSAICAEPAMHVSV
jgi:hypothetical protein